MAPDAEEPFFEDEEDPAIAKDSHRNEILLQCKLYRILLEKYADLINEKERRTIGEIKALVNMDDLTIQSILADFKGKDYSFLKDYTAAAEKILK